MCSYLIPVLSLQTNRVVTIFSLKLRILIIPLSQIIGVVSGAILYDVMVLIVWMALDAPKYTSTVSGNSLQSTIQYDCESSRGTLWLGLLAIPKLIAVLKLLEISYKMRAVTDIYNESRVLAVSVWNIAFVSTVIIPIIFFTEDVDGKWFLEFMSIAWVVNATTALLVISKIRFHLGPDTVVKNSGATSNVKVNTTFTDAGKEVLLAEVEKLQHQLRDCVCKAKDEVKRSTVDALQSLKDKREMKDREKSAKVGNFKIAPEPQSGGSH